MVNCSFKKNVSPNNQGVENWQLTISAWGLIKAMESKISFIFRTVPKLFWLRESMKDKNYFITGLMHSCTKNLLQTWFILKTWSAICFIMTHHEPWTMNWHSIWLFAIEVLDDLWNDTSLLKLCINMFMFMNFIVFWAKIWQNEQLTGMRVRVLNKALIRALILPSCMSAAKNEHCRQQWSAFFVDHFPRNVCLLGSLLAT